MLCYYSTAGMSHVGVLFQHSRNVGCLSAMTALWVSRAQTSRVLAWHGDVSVL